jgi:hypothetical protein
MRIVLSFEAMCCVMEQSNPLVRAEHETMATAESTATPNDHFYFGLSSWSQSGENVAKPSRPSFTASGVLHVGDRVIVCKHPPGELAHQRSQLFGIERNRNLLLALGPGGTSLAQTPRRKRPPRPS